jgi:hypothetical protein
VVFIGQRNLTNADGKDGPVGKLPKFQPDPILPIGAESFD